MGNVVELQSRPYQQRIVSKSMQMFNGQYRNGAGFLQPHSRSILIESPTGSGKTVMGWMVAKELQKTYPTLVVAWVAMRRNLLIQAAAENINKRIGVQNVHMVSMFDKNLERLLELKNDGHKILMVVDECQHDSCSSMAHIHNVVVPDFVLGLSATPFRSDRVKLCFDSIIRDAGIHQLIQDGYLSKYHSYTIPDWSVKTVCQTFIREPERWGKSIFYFVNLEQCFECHQMLSGAGVRCDVVTGDSDVDGQLLAFRNGEIDVLINCMKLTEGFDSPDLKTAFVRDSSKGCTMQMAGRVLRKHPGISAKQVVQSKHTRWPMLKTAIPEQQYVWQENMWMSLTVNPNMARVSTNTRLAVAQINPQLPLFITASKKKKRNFRL
jgi:superfamily II DNA or RNA helicase